MGKLETSSRRCLKSYWRLVVELIGHEGCIHTVHVITFRMDCYSEATQPSFSAIICRVQSIKRYSNFTDLGDKGHVGQAGIMRPPKRL